MFDGFIIVYLRIIAGLIHMGLSFLQNVQRNAKKYSIWSIIVDICLIINHTLSPYFISLHFVQIIFCPNELCKIFVNMGQIDHLEEDGLLRTSNVENVKPLKLYQ